MCVVHRYSWSISLCTTHIWIHNVRVCFGWAVDTSIHDMWCSWTNAWSIFFLCLPFIHIFLLETTEKSSLPLHLLMFDPCTAHFLHILLFSSSHTWVHYYKNIDLSRLGNPCCPGFPTGNASLGQKRCPFVPGPATGTKEHQPGQKVPFFMFSFSQLFFYFNYTFAFQLNLCIGIQCVWSLLIYTYIYSYLYNICPR